MIFTQHRIIQALESVGIPTSKIHTCDNQYVVIDDAQADNYFRGLAAQTIKVFVEWRKEYKDCDKYSRLLQALALVSHSYYWDKEGEELAGLAVGVLNYKKENGEGHSINFLITKEKESDDLYVIFYEPQTGVRITLTRNERNNTKLALL